MAASPSDVNSLEIRHARDREDDDDSKTIGETKDGGDQTNTMIELELRWTSPPKEEEEEGAGNGSRLAQGGGLSEPGPPPQPGWPGQEQQRLELALTLQGAAVQAVLQADSLTTLLDAAIALCRQDSANLSEECRKFCCDTLPMVFTRLLTSPNLPSWKRETQVLIKERSLQVLELVVLRMKMDDGGPCLTTAKLLAVLFNPNTLFHIHNFSQKSDNSTSSSERTEDQFAKSTDAGETKGWLVDFINRFGRLGGFRALAERMDGGGELGASSTAAACHCHPHHPLQLVAALLRPWEDCCVYLNMETLEQYFLAIMNSTLRFLGKHREFESNAKNQSSCDSIFQSLKKILSVLPGTNIDSRIEIRSQITQTEEQIRQWLEECGPSAAAAAAGSSLQSYMVDIHALAMDGGQGSSAVRTIVVESAPPSNAATPSVAAISDECRVIVEDGSSSLDSVAGAVAGGPGGPWWLERQESSNMDVCRVCFEGQLSSKNRLIQPCNCAGSQAYIHQRCLVKWIRISQNRNCEICFSRFHHIPISERVHSCLGELRRNKRWRNAAFATLVGLIVILYLVIFAVFPGGLIQD